MDDLQRFVVLTSGRVPSWVLRGENGLPAKFMRDPANDHYWFGSTVYANETAFLLATGGSVSSSARVFGPYVDPSGFNWLTNGDFSDGTTGWAAVGTGASIANVAGELETTSGGSLNAYTQGVSGTLGKAFRFIATGRQGTSTNTFLHGYAATSALSGAYGSAGFSSTSNVTRTMYAASVGDTTYVGIRNTSGIGAGTAYFDNLSLVEAKPLKNWTPSDITALVEATTPAVAETQVVFQCDVANERDRVRIVWNGASDNHLHVVATVNNLVQADLDLGSVAQSTAFSVSFSFAQSSFSASLDGGTPVTDAAGICPGVAYMQIGKSFTGEAWSGSDPLVAIF